MITSTILLNGILKDIATCNFYFAVIMFAPYCYKQEVVNYSYVLQQVQTLSLL